MNEKLIIKRSDELLNRAKMVFGENLVVDAYITTWRFDSCKKNEIEKRLDDCERRIKSCDNYISYDTEKIIVKFINGRMIKFWNSEWAGMEIVEEKVKEY